MSTWFDAWWKQLTPNEKAGMYEDYLVGDFPLELLTQEQRDILDARVELARLKYIAADTGKPFRTN